MASDLRRRDLMDASEQLFAHKGVAVTTVDDITRAAGVAKGTFYLYFSSKDDLLTALRGRFVEDCGKRIAMLAARLPAADWIGRLDAWVEGGIRHYLDHIELHDVLFLAGEHEHGSMADSPLVTGLAELIRAGMAAGVWRVEAPEFVSLFLFYAIHGIVDYIATSRRTDHKAVIRLSQKIVQRTLGVVPPPDGRRTVKPS